MLKIILKFDLHSPCVGIFLSLSHQLFKDGENEAEERKNESEEEPHVDHLDVRRLPVPTISFEQNLESPPWAGWQRWPERECTWPAWRWGGRWWSPQCAWCAHTSSPARWTWWCWRGGRWRWHGRQSSSWPSWWTWLFHQFSWRQLSWLKTGLDPVVLCNLGFVEPAQPPPWGSRY